jgi:hypothetical protein
LLLLRLLWLRLPFLLRTTAATATASSPLCPLFAFGSRLLLLLLLRRTWWSLWSGARFGRRPAAGSGRRSTGPLPLRTLAAARTLFARLPLFLARARAGALLELAHLLVHESPRLLLLFIARLVMPAIRTAFPPLGVGPFARRAEDTFWQRHRNRRALYTSARG